MFDIGWSELLLIGVVALIVIGPEDLPRMFHALGRMTAKARSMAREFSSAMEDAARESGIKDATDGLRDVRGLTSKKALGLDALDRAVDKFEKWDPKRPSTKAQDAPGGAAAPEKAQQSEAAKPAAAAVPESAAVAAMAPATSDAAAAAAVPDPEADEATAGRRQLKAVRRSDRQE